MGHNFIKVIFAVFALIFFSQPIMAQSQLKIGVATIERKPFAFQQEGEWHGFTIDLWNRIAENLNLETSFEEAENFVDLLNKVETGQVDLAGANISVTSAREEIMDFSQPIFDAGLMIMNRDEDTSSVLDALWNPKLLVLLFAAICLFICAGAIIAWFERKSPHFEGLQKPKSLEEGIWWAVSVVTNASFTIFTPITMAGRLMAYLLIIIGLFVVSAFVAQITASLTVETLRSQVGGVNDLRGKRVATTDGSTSSRYLSNISIEHSTYQSLDSLYSALENNTIDYVVHDAPILAFYAKSEGRGKFKTVGGVFNPEKYSFALPTNSPLRESINRQLLRLRESGEHAELVKKWFGSNY
jgi:polar amino acid transport system substrate-binding protein